MALYLNAWKNVRFRCAGIESPQSVDEVVALVGRVRDRDGGLKPVGGRHSFNHNLRTADTLLDIGALNRPLRVDAKTGLAELEAGMTIADAIAGLAPHGLPFTTLGPWP